MCDTCGVTQASDDPDPEDPREAPLDGEEEPDLDDVDVGVVASARIIKGKEAME